MSDTPQKTWDACLIKCWRENKKLWQCRTMFKAITGLDAESAGILRTGLTTPGYVPVQLFVAQRLPKISERLFAKDKKHDVALLNALQKSKYTTATVDLNRDNEYKQQAAAYKKNISVVELDVKRYSERNKNTDWKTLS